MHQFRDKKQLERRKRLYKNIIFVIVFFVFVATGIISYTSGLFYFIGKPFWKINNSINSGVENIGYLVRSKSSVFKENEQLKKENTELKNSMIDYEIIKKENLDLKDLLLRKPESKDLMLVDILTKPNYSPYDTIVIDAGSRLGLSKGNVVYGNTVLPIGVISEVYDNASLVLLYSNPGQVTEGMIDGTNTSVELIGRGGGNFEMLIPNELNFNKGTYIYKPNISTEILAIVSGTISSPTDPLKRVLLYSPLNVQNLKWVFVEKK